MFGEPFIFHIQILARCSINWSIQQKLDFLNIPMNLNSIHKQESNFS